MLLIKVTAEQRQHLMDAMDLVVKATGIGGLEKALPLISAIQSAETAPDVVQQPDLKVVGKEAVSKD